ncbi:MAG: hypothetical protein KDB03_10890 [Planctomycetales bacterium]|nr:hypothetical protein [Planctomycetales bacterium]
MNENESIPEILQAEWSQDQVLALFADLSQGAEIEHVQLRTPSADQTISLAEAQSLFVQGCATAIQVRYMFEGEMWCDTILPGEPTTKIIRTKLPNHS